LALRRIDWGEIETCELTKANLQQLLVADFDSLREEKAANEKQLYRARSVASVESDS
jgi:hypothetical protein